MNAIVTVVVALVAGSVAGFVSSRLAVPVESPPVPAGIEWQRLLDLELRVAALAKPVPSPAPAVGVERAAYPAREPAAVVDAEARRRLDALEQAVARLPRAVLGVAATDAPPAVAPAPSAPKPTAAELRQALVAATTDAEKIAAWSKLRQEPNAYDDAVVAVMVQVGLSSQDPAIRADVWRQADSRSTHPALASAMIRSLQSDGEARVREEAAETLENYLDVPGVRQALAAAQSADVDEAVRKQAARTLEPRRR